MKGKYKQTGRQRNIKKFKNNIKIIKKGRTENSQGNKKRRREQSMQALGEKVTYWHVIGGLDCNTRYVAAST